MEAFRFAQNALMQTNFLLGTIQLTEPARMKLKRLPYDLVARHAINEHGLITARERKRNRLSMQTVGPIISRYRVDPNDPKAGYVLVETDATWSNTLISLE